MKPFSLWLSLLTASTLACPGSLSSMEIFLPKTISLTNKTTSLRAKWSRPRGFEMGKFGPINCDGSPGYDDQYIYGSLNITGYEDGYKLVAMDHFENLKGLDKNGDTPIGFVIPGMGWHVGGFESKGGKIKKLSLDVLVEGQVIQKEYKEKDFEYRTNVTGYSGLDGVLATIGDGWKSQ